MALVELRQILLLLIFCTCGLALINVETNNYISQSEKNLTETREEISANGDSLWNSFLFMVLNRVFWMSKTTFYVYKFFLFIFIFEALHFLLNKIHKILPYVVFMFALSFLVYNKIWIGWIILDNFQIINSILNIWTVSAFLVGFFVVSLAEVNYGGVNEIITQSLMIAIFLFPIIKEIYRKRFHSKSRKSLKWHFLTFLIWQSKNCIKTKL